MKTYFCLALTCFLAGCTDPKDGSISGIEIDQTFTAEMASQALSQGLENHSMLKVFAVCGPSAGKGLYGDNKFRHFQADGISQGRMIFYSTVDGTGANVMFRDAGGSYISSLIEGADVRILDEESRMWIISYPSTGIVETHNFVFRDGQLLDLWTANKPAVSAWEPSARVFTSRCFRP